MKRAVDNAAFYVLSSKGKAATRHHALRFSKGLEHFDKGLKVLEQTQEEVKCQNAIQVSLSILKD